MIITVMLSVWISYSTDSTYILVLIVTDERMMRRRRKSKRRRNYNLLLLFTHCFLRISSSIIILQLTAPILLEPALQSIHLSPFSLKEFRVS